MDSQAKGNVMALLPGKRDFSELLRAVPSKPGVYLMRDKLGGVLYVGKAGNLRNRLRSYFGKKAGPDPKIRSMIPQIADFEFILTESDEEAVLLECNLIKENKPPYNSRLKDDKSYPFIKIDTSEDFSRVYITRGQTSDGSLYFGPYASAYSVRRTLALLKKLFPYRSCTKTITGTDARPCLDYHINRCVGPCIGAVDKEEYGEVIDHVTLFLKGRTDRVAKQVARQMEEAAERLEFERAAALRDQYRAIEKVSAGQKVLHLSPESIDAIGLSIEGGRGVGRGLLHQGGEAGRARQLHHGEPRGGRAWGRDHCVRRAVLQRQPLRAAPYPDAARHGGDGGAGVMAGTVSARAGSGCTSHSAARSGSSWRWWLRTQRRGPGAAQGTPRCPRATPRRESANSRRR